jgi:hypothetical protein
MDDTVGEVVPVAVSPTGNSLAHDGDDAPVAPKLGSLAWLHAQGTVEHLGAQVPTCHRIPTDASLTEADGSRCRVVLASGDRCKGTRLKVFGLCMGHAGGGGTRDLPAMQERSNTKRSQLKLTKQILGYGPKRAADPRVAVRLRAAQQANEIAIAVVDEPLRAELPVLDKQRAMLAVLDAAFPLQQATLSLEISEPDSMAWQDLEALASSLDS